MRIGPVLSRSLGAALAMLLTSACNADRSLDRTSSDAGAPDAGGVPIDPGPDHQFDPIGRVFKGEISLFDAQGQLQETRTVSVDVLFWQGIQSPNAKTGDGLWHGSFWLGNGTFENEVKDGPYFTYIGLDSSSGKSLVFHAQLSRGGDCPYEVTGGVLDLMRGEVRGHALVFPHCELEANRGLWEGDFVLTNSGQQVPTGRMVVLNREPVVPNGGIAIQFTLPRIHSSSDFLEVQADGQTIEGYLSQIDSIWRPTKALVPNAPITLDGFFRDVNMRPMGVNEVVVPATTTADIADLSLATEPPSGALWHAKWQPGSLSIAPGSVDGLVSGLISLGAPTGGETKLRIRMTQSCPPSPAPALTSRAALVDSRGEVTPIDISCDETSEAVSVSLPGEGPLWLSIASDKADSTGMAAITIRDLAFEL